MKTTDLQIERIENPTLEYFQKHILPARKPVIITGIVNKWKVYSLWTADYLNNLVGDNEIPVCTSENPIITVDGENEFDKFIRPMKFRDFLEDVMLHKYPIF